MVYSDLSYAHKRLRDTLGPERVSVGELEKLVYGHDFSPLPKQAGMQFITKPDLMVLPKTTQEVVRVVRLGEELEFPVVPRGGGTSFHGGSVPNMGGILLSTNLMDRMDEVDPGRRFVTVQAGTRWKDVEEAAAAEGMALPVLPVFHRSSTVGGFLSNGGVGIGSYRHGPAARWVRSLQVVLPDGGTLETGDPSLDLGARNHNLTRLFLGAEGTLGVITKATLRLVPAPEETRTTAYRFESLRTMGYALARLARMPISPYHVGYVDEAHLVLQRALLKDLPEVPALAAVTFRGTKAAVEAEEKLAHDCMVASGGEREDDEVATLLWEERHTPYRARRLSGGLVAAEGVVPTTRVADLALDAAAAAKEIKSEAAVHGFLADRGSAYVAPYVLTNEGTLRGQFAISFVERFHQVLPKHGGHPMGLGMLTTYNAGAMYGHVVAYLRGVKEALDPHGNVNPGKLLATMGRELPTGLIPRELPAGLVRRGLRALGVLRKLLPGERFVTKARGGR